MKKSPPINQKNFLAYNRPDLHKGLYNKEFIYKKKELHFVKKYQNNSNICEIIFEKDKKIVIWYSNINDCTEIHKFLLGSNSDKMAENLIKIVNEKAGVTFSSKNEKNNQRIPEMNGAKYSNSLYTTHFVSKFIEYIVANLYRDVFKDLLEYKIDYLSPKSIIK